ncbi:MULTISPECIES: MarR family winged helix-turn-helix transcriptional regulator [Paraburkholderia]|uniref:DNA-binding MarR family transcriptional regulator n=2 Tax=Paraburkholderia TaxID=1822464 RepID=A0A7Z0B0T7_9BURK|nr:MarR family transcriptional regulator [Paraburkholderia bryophila]NYH15697.1 DNA-binding MarR family transcriptional regulator [Paraburkholderia bryophila]NYH25861.1 DNA-binding MarR family transcriptional regulator [Paraburkholderia bryophila]
MPVRKQLPNPMPLIGLINRGFTRIFDAQLRQLGFAVGQIPVLNALKGGKALPQSELARLARVEQPTMAQLLSRMERDEIVDRVADPADKRSRLISLTADAEKRLPKARAILFAGSEDALSGLSDDEVTQLVELLERVNANIERMSEQAGDA